LGIEFLVILLSLGLLFSGIGWIMKGLSGD
jgi:hypothetical protein